MKNHKQLIIGIFVGLGLALILFLVFVCVQQQRLLSSYQDQAAINGSTSASTTDAPMSELTAEASDISDFPTVADSQQLLATYDNATEELFCLRIAGIDTIPDWAEVYMNLEDGYGNIVTIDNFKDCIDGELIIEDLSLMYPAEIQITTWISTGSEEEYDENSSNQSIKVIDLSDDAFSIRDPKVILYSMNLTTCNEAEGNNAKERDSYTLSATVSICHAEDATWTSKYEKDIAAQPSFEPYTEYPTDVPDLYAYLSKAEWQLKQEHGQNYIPSNEELQERFLKIIAEEPEEVQEYFERIGVITTE